MGIGREFREGEQMVYAKMDMETLHRIDQEIAEQMEITIRVKSCKYKDDPTHCELLKAFMKYKTKLRDREFELNNK